MGRDVQKSEIRRGKCKTIFLQISCMTQITSIKAECLLDLIRNMALLILAGLLYIDFMKDKPS